MPNQDTGPLETVAPPDIAGLAFVAHAASRASRGEWPDEQDFRKNLEEWTAVAEAVVAALRTGSTGDPR